MDGWILGNNSRTTQELCFVQNLFIQGAKHTPPTA